ncbi:hypothetical protein KEJ45_06375 [Candidatus Bathyarchaeota archaeon]|nr:hypothetical protein [Candidatus Bathyarchaeota archaeon]
MNAKNVALIAVMSAVTVVVAYARGLGLPFLPGLVEFMTVLIFVSGFCFGCVIGGFVGIIAITIYMLIPYPFAHPVAWLFTISPILLLVMAFLGALYGIVGGFFGKVRNSVRINARFVAELAFLGFVLTLFYDVFSSVGFYLAYPVYSSVWEAIYLTFIPLYYPYPPIIHTFTNTLVFAVLAPALIHAIHHFSMYLKVPSNV